jgi:hypothetical protein
MPVTTDSNAARYLEYVSLQRPGWIISFQGFEKMKKYLLNSVFYLVRL